MALNLRSWLHNNANKLLVLVCWFIINLALFVYAFEKYRTRLEFYYSFHLLGHSLCVSRASAQVIYFNAALILLPMCRVLTTKLRTFTGKYWKSSARRLVDEGVCLHMLCGYTILLAAVVHAIGHLKNCYHFYSNFNHHVMGVNVMQHKSEITIAMFLKSIPGWTGILMITILAILIILSLPVVRRKKFEFFWYTHHLSLFFYVLLIFHGFGGMIKYQTNLDKHPPGCETSNNETMCSEPAEFKPVRPVAWIWILVPLVLYAIDRLIRFCRGNGDVELTKVAYHHSNVVELVMKKKRFSAKPGQYVLVQCPDVAEFEWHPFTLTKCPSGKKDAEEEEFSIHMKIVGEWTRKVSERLGLVDNNWIISNNHNISSELDGCFVIDVNDPMSMVQEPKPTEIASTRIKIDGPYGAASQDVTRFPIGICVCAGIGVTPFAAMLNYIKSGAYRSAKHKLKRLHFIWVCRSFDDFTWFLKLLYSTHKQMQENDISDFFVVHFFITQSRSLPKKSNGLGEERIVWMNNRLKYGRPNWTRTLGNIAEQHQKERIGVFYCGPKPLSETLKKTCEQITSNNNVLVYHSESFE